MSIFAPQTEVPLWPVPTRRFASLGWQEFSLPDGALYFSNTTLHTVTDVDLRSAERLDAITTYLEGLDTEVLPPPEWELWLRDANASGSMTGFVPIKAWVHHGARMVLSERPSSDPGEIINKGVDSKLLRVHLPRCLCRCFDRDTHGIPVLVVYGVSSRSCIAAIGISLRSHRRPDVVVYWYVVTHFAICLAIHSPRVRPAATVAPPFLAPIQPRRMSGAFNATSFF